MEIVAVMRNAEAGRLPQATDDERNERYELSPGLIPFPVARPATDPVSATTGDDTRQNIP